MKADTRGVEQVKGETQTLFRLFTEHLQESASAAPLLGLEWAEHAGAFGARSPKASVYIQRHIEYSNSLSDSWLSIREMGGGIILPGERRNYLREPKVFGDIRYEPDRRVGVAWGWRAGTNCGLPAIWPTRQRAD